MGLMGLMGLRVAVYPSVGLLIISLLRYVSGVLFGVGGVFGLGHVSVALEAAAFLAISWSSVIVVSGFLQKAVVLLQRSRDTEEGPLETRPRAGAGVRRISNVLLPDWLVDGMTALRPKSVPTEVALSGPVGAVLKEMIHFIIRDFVVSWYPSVSDDKNPKFIAEVQKLLEDVFADLVTRASRIDAVNLVYTDVLSSVQEHLKMFNELEALKKMSGSNISSSVESEWVMFEHVAASQGVVPHPGAARGKRELSYLRKYSDLLLSHVLPETDYRCKVAKFLVIEIMTCKVLKTVMDFCSPDFVNLKIEFALQDWVPGDAAASLSLSPLLSAAANGDLPPSPSATTRPAQALQHELDSDSDDDSCVEDIDASTEPPALSLGCSHATDGQLRQQLHSELKAKNNLRDRIPSDEFPDIHPSSVSSKKQGVFVARKLKPMAVMLDRLLAHRPTRKDLCNQNILHSSDIFANRPHIPPPSVNQGQSPESSFSSPPTSNLKPLHSGTVVQQTQRLQVAITDARVIKGVKRHVDYRVDLRYGPDVWCVYRRYKQFRHLQRYVADNLPGLSLDLPPKKAWGNLKKRLLEERQCALEKYLRDLIQDSRALNHGAIWDFFRLENDQKQKNLPTDISQKESVTQTVSPVAKRKSKIEAKEDKPSTNGSDIGFIGGLKAPSDHAAMSPTSNRLSTEVRPSLRSKVKQQWTKGVTAIKKLAKRSPKKIRDEMRFAKNLYELLDQIFEFGDAGWIRRKLLWILKSVIESLDGTISGWITTQIEFYCSLVHIEQVLQLIKDTIWPNGHFPEEEVEEKRSAEQVAYTRLQAHQLLQKHLPAFGQRVIGEGPWRQGIDRTFNMIQNETVLRHLGYSLLERITVQLLPESVMAIKSLREHV
eukprot:GILJ01005814.1.p1 GENE.GILJ01005814.1~~GILJ01005814.1.p1  ORF type:complete len:882 (+),score=122.37 GILJ01005814.1:88-2733(+)